MDLITPPQARYFKGDKVLFTNVPSDIRWTICCIHWSHQSGVLYDIRSNNVTLFDVPENILTLAMEKAA